MAEATATATAEVAVLAVTLGRALRRAGLPVTPSREVTFARAVALARPREPSDLYWPARVALVSSRDQLAAFEGVFARLLGGVADPADTRGDTAAPPLTKPRPQAAEPASPAAAPLPAPAAGDGPPSPAADGPPRDDARDLPVGTAASEAERLANARLDTLTPAELATVADLLRRLKLATPPRRARRTHASRRGDHLDVRATLAHAHRTGGDPVTRLHRRRRTHARPLVALLDVSGSMAPYARAYLLLLEGAARGARAETFVFATQLTRVTRALREGRPDAALARAGRAAPDWAGGTRIGEALRVFNDRWGRRGMARGAFVVILSDGWERGDPALVGVQTERLARLAHRIVWVNPRVSAPGYAPLVGGMAAALPHVDELVAGHSLAALDEVVAAIGRDR